MESRAGRTRSVSDRVGKREGWAVRHIAATRAGLERRRSEQPDPAGREMWSRRRDQAKRSAPQFPQIPHFLLYPVSRIGNRDTGGVPITWEGRNHEALL